MGLFDKIVEGVQDKIPIGQGVCAAHRAKIEDTFTELEKKFAQHKRQADESVAALQIDIASINDTKMPHQAKKISGLESSLQKIDTQLAELTQWRTDYRKELVAALAEVCNKHLAAIDQKCQEEGQAMLSHLSKAEEAAERSQKTADGILNQAEALKTRWDGDAQAMLEECRSVFVQIENARDQALGAVRKAETLVENAHQLNEDIRKEWQERDSRRGLLASLWNRFQRWVRGGNK